MLTFSATISSRSSKNTQGPPSESEILALNPQRCEMILNTTGWDKLFPGTLNLEVDEEIVHRLLLCTPLIREDASDIRYPDGSTHIQKLRVGYLYYTGRIERRGKKVSVLIRRACNPLKKRLEAFSQERIRDVLILSEGETVICKVDE